ncbi:hypothetical protein VTI74DRAFT_11591 [Chaetomium olivicolor]
MARLRAQTLPNPPRVRPAYTYSPLPSPCHIRLIRLLKYDLALSQDYITLTSHPIDALTHRFTALSYTWGSAIEPFELPPSQKSFPSNPRNIELIIVPPESFDTFSRKDDPATTEGCLLDMYTTDVRYLVVTGNLSDFFRSYMVNFPDRHPENGKGRVDFQQVSHLWIDAVCIDQNNPEEKASQISLMGKIYFTSARVLAWLGAEERRLGTFLWWHRAVWPVISKVMQEGGNDAMMKLREGKFTDGQFWRDVVGFEGVPIGGSWV